MSDKLTQANQYIRDNRQSVKTRYRNRYHAMPPIGWMNDPNGFNYAFGRYQLFYQFHPYSAVWGPMHWGHLSSDDLIVWHDEPVAIAPDAPYDGAGCFSGSSYFEGGKLYLMYTSVCGDRQTQALACSEDGVTYEKLGLVIPSEKIPSDCLVTDFRDPKLFVKDGLYYSMIGATAKNGAARILLYKSADMKDWDYAGTVLEECRGTICECPDYFVLDGREVVLTNPQNMACDGIKYQNFHANLYFIGRLNFSTGKFEKAYEGELDKGFDFYAAQTLKAPDGRRIMIGWMSMWDRTNVTAEDGWAGCMTLPRELSVIDGKIYQQPVREIERYRGMHYRVAKKRFAGELPLPDFGAAQEICVAFDIGTAEKVGLKLFKGESRVTYLYYDAKTNLVVFDRTQMGKAFAHGPAEKDAYVRYADVNIKDGILKMRLFLDVSSCEAFLGDGERVMTANIYADAGDDKHCLFAEGGDATVVSLDLYGLEINKKTKNKIGG